MPLIKSKSAPAFTHNLKVEMNSGKSKAQSLAIAYATQRHAKKRRMADGGKVSPNQHEYMSAEEQNASLREGRPLADLYNPKKDHEVSASDLMEDDERATSIADAIMRKRRMADGGKVDIQMNGEEEGSSPYDRMNSTAVKKELYDDDQLSAQPTDSNEIGDSREDEQSNKHDMISAIRRKLRAKAGL